MKLLDLFTGIGGFSLAFKRIWPEGEIIGFSEIDKYAISIYRKHFEGVKALGSVTDVRPDELPDFDIVTFGFPCQDLSIAGKRKGLDGRRSGLFYEAIRIINAKRPEYFIFENVKGLFSSAKGEDFIEVLQSIADIGYSGQWQMLNTKWFLPQNRERIFFVGHLGGIARPEIFPFREGDFEHTEQRVSQSGVTGIVNDRGSLREVSIAGNIDANYFKGADNHGQRTLVKIGHVGEKDMLTTRIYSSDGLASTLSGNGGGMGGKTGLYKIAGWHENENIIAAHKSDAKRSTVSEHVYHKPEGIASALTVAHHTKVIIGGKEIVPTIRAEHHNTADVHYLSNRTGIRRLTPLETERLQGFPDSWTQYGINGNSNEVLISDTQRYRCTGNAITVNVAEEIFRRLKASIEK